MKRIEALVFRVGEKSVIEQIGSSLEAMQKIVGGYIQALPLGSGLVLICNEEGRLKGLPVNRHFIARAPEAPANVAFFVKMHPGLCDPGELGEHVIHGTFFIVRQGNENFASLKPNDADCFVD